MPNALDRSLEDLIKVKQPGAAGKGKGKGKKAAAGQRQKGKGRGKKGSAGKNAALSRAAGGAGAKTKKGNGKGKKLSAMKKVVQKSTLKQKLNRAAKLKKSLQNKRKGTFLCVLLPNLFLADVHVDILEPTSIRLRGPRCTRGKNLIIFVDRSSVEEKFAVSK